MVPDLFCGDAYWQCGDRFLSSVIFCEKILSHRRLNIRRCVAVAVWLLMIRCIWCRWIEYMKAVRMVLVSTSGDVYPR
jgi:hypothetical protein